MTEALAVIVGALVGAVSGLAGGGFAAMASFRASLVTARAPLGPILHDISRAVIQMNSARDRVERERLRLVFEIEWNRFAIEQRILCPSKKINSLMDFVRSVAKNENEDREDLTALSGQIVDKVSRMVGAYSNHIIPWNARRHETKILKEWIASEGGHSLSEPIRRTLAELSST